jgi:hypothetical protein
MLRNSNDPKDRAIAFAAYQEAADLAKNNSNYWGGSLAEAGIVHDWLIAEAYVGDCTTAASLLPRFVELLSRQDVLGDVKKSAEERMYNLLIQQPRCGLDLNKIRPESISQRQPPPTTEQKIPPITPSTGMMTPMPITRQP